MFVYAHLAAYVIIQRLEVINNLQYIALCFCIVEKTGFMCDTLAPIERTSGVIQSLVSQIQFWE